MWIEITLIPLQNTKVSSLPTRECGLKSKKVKDNYTKQLESLPTRECGLKFVRRELVLYPDEVTPYAGVWIEIGQASYTSFSSLSLPTRECGLKFLINEHTRKFCLSLPTRECGLKCRRDWLVA